MTRFLESQAPQNKSSSFTLLDHHFMAKNFSMEAAMD
jgi:hypothetical protein